METNSSPTSEQNKQSKSPRFRSVAYPSFTIQHCADLVTRIHKIFGNLTFTPRERLSKELNISDSHLQTQLSSCVQFGLLELKSKEGYKPTPLFTKLYRPTPNEKIEDAYLQAFQSPELYKGLIAQFNNQELPQEVGLAAILFRDYKVSDQASTAAAKIFVENAKFVNAINEDSQFKIPGSDENDEIPFVEVITPPNNSNSKDTFFLLESQSKPPTLEVKLPILLDDGKTINIPLPNGINKADLEKIKKVIDAYL